MKIWVEGGETIAALDYPCLVFSRRANHEIKRAGGGTFQE